MEEELQPLMMDEIFKFGCMPGVSCFNDCCRDLNQFLTPYDILVLKRDLGLLSDEFLRKYTSEHTGPQTGLPVVSFRLDPAKSWACPFVSENGCRVYKSRPSACRAYPLTRLAIRDRSNGTLEERYFLLREDHCKGFEQEHLTSVREWVSSQGLDPYNRANDRFMEIIAVKNQQQDRSLDLREKHIFSTALYNIDEFRRWIEEGRVEAAEIDESMLQDDERLLDFSIDWVLRRLFGQAR